MYIALIKLTLYKFNFMKNIVKIPKALKNGSRVAIIAPAGRVFKHELDFAVKWLKENNWEAVISDELFNEHNFGYYYAGTDNHRAKQLQNALDNKNIDAIWFARGGYGSIRLIDNLNFDKFMQNPKWIIGYSDITVFHNHLNNMNICTIHGVTAKQLNTKYSNETYSSLADILKGNSINHRINQNVLNIKGNSKGKLVGGNLSIIYSQLGSNSSIKDDGIILLIEDWQENWYHLDRMIMGIKRSGLFAKLKGVIVGSFTKMDIENENPDYEKPFDTLSNKIIRSHLEELNIPICFNFPIGHIGDNRALILGSDVELIVNEKYSELIFS